MYAEVRAILADAISFSAEEAINKLTRKVDALRQACEAQIAAAARLAPTLREAKMRSEYIEGLYADDLQTLQRKIDKLTK